MSTDGFRVTAPVRSKSGELVIDGWTATAYLKGEHSRRGPEIISVGQRFHGALVGVSRPDVLDLRQDKWAVANRVAWEQAVPSRVAQSIPGVEWLLDAREPVGASPQLIHGDPSGNVILADDAAPAVIDFSPYWRPRDYASAIVAIDAIA